MPVMIENLNSQTVTPAVGKNPRRLYEHQEEALKRLDEINRKSSFNTLLVLPTGGGKTLTAAYWLLKNAVDKGKKVLWTAHRHLLLEQAAEAFAHNAYTDTMINRTVFNYRIISGLHDKPVHITKNDSVLIAGKDSIIRSLDSLSEWIQDEDIYLVIDEAHHAVAKSYRKIIRYAQEHAKSVKLLGLTATPFRTSDEEQGALKQIFTDGIVYKTDLEALIKRGILAAPFFNEYRTDIRFTEHLGVNALMNIENLDIIPEDIAGEIAENKERNNMIVNTYMENRDKYGPTIVFALNQTHAVALNALFNKMGKKYGIKSDFIISSVRDTVTGITISSKENEQKIEKYKNGELQVLININILTEGTDLPKTHTVFLTRPTTSTVLMTQMIGRALRGVKAGGTKDAYIVSFIDDWNNRIAWVNPENLTDSEYKERESEREKREYNIRLIAISKIEEFALMADSSVDTSGLDSIDPIERIPLGMYSFSTLECNHQILIYNCTSLPYKSLIADLTNIMEHFGIDSEVIPDDRIEEMVHFCFENYFDENMVPACNLRDIENLLKFYAQKEVKPLFITFDEIDRRRLDISDIAKKIHDNDMRRSEISQYIDDLWNEEGSILRIYYTNLYYLKRMIDIECDRLDGYIQTASVEPRCESEKRDLEKFPLQKIIEVYPKYGIMLRENTFNSARSSSGEYICACCGKKFRTRERLQVDHIIPMAKGGLTVPENLQVLCCSCNMRKSDR